MEQEEIKRKIDSIDRRINKALRELEELKRKLNINQEVSNQSTLLMSLQSIGDKLNLVNPEYSNQFRLACDEYKVNTIVELKKISFETFAKSKYIGPGARSALQKLIDEGSLPWITSVATRITLPAITQKICKTNIMEKDVYKTIAKMYKTEGKE